MITAFPNETAHCQFGFVMSRQQGWVRQFVHKHFFSSQPPPAEGFLAGLGTSKFLAHTREKTWTHPELAQISNKETQKLNTCQAINEALSTALSTDSSARKL